MPNKANLANDLLEKQDLYMAKEAKMKNFGNAKKFLKEFQLE
jgi:hypothetical protein